MENNLFEHKRKSYCKIGEIYFWTATINNWQLLLLNDELKDLIVDSLNHLSLKNKIDVFAFVIMPKKSHKQSRLLFINEAKKLYQKEFIRWFTLTSEINPLLKFFRAKDILIPTLYIMGEEDHLFLPSVRKIVQIHKTSDLLIAENCGHVVNVDQPKFFNTESIKFISLLG